MRDGRARWGLVWVVAVMGLLVSCSSDDDGDGADEERTSTTVDKRDDGPKVAFAGPLEGGAGIALGSAALGPDLEAAGFTEAEYTAAGTATSYTATATPADGAFELEPADEAEFVTRVVVRRPAEADAFNGTVVLEWLNVSGGLDAAADYTYLAEEVVRQGYAWIGVSAQRIGVEGGETVVPVPGLEGSPAGKGLKGQDPERYGDLSHPGDSFSYDMFTQIARTVRSPGGGDPLEGLEVERVLAVGESQSAFTLTTYVNGVQPLTQQFDGFLIHSRGGAPAPVTAPSGSIDIAGSITGEPTQIRGDGDTPVMVVQTETDVLGFFGYVRARQPDTERFRLWEIAGTAHADKFQLGEGEAMLGCADPINRGQQVFVLRAALRHLDTWAREGTAPPEAPRLDVDESGSTPTYVLDGDGMVTGGVRTPAVDVPVDVLTGVAAPGSSIICTLMGSTKPLAAARLGELYASRADYESAYEAAVDEMIAAGFALEDDREHLLADAQPDRIAAG